MSSPKLVLVDGSSYLFRAFHALPPLTTATGQPTGAIYGVLNMLRRLLKDYEPDAVAVVFDPKGGSFRNRLYAEYKANRAEMPDDLRVQIQPLHDIIRAMGLPLLVVDDMEADDVIGTLVKHAEAQGYQTIVSTGDKDMAQLVTSQTSLINTMNNKVMDIPGVETKFGVKPEQIIDYLTLIGDTSDNIPGVPKVGPKTAAKWLAQYGSLDVIVEHADEIKGKVGENLRAFIPQVPLTRELVTIKCDVPLDTTIDQLKQGEQDVETLKHFFTELEFRNWLAELDVEDDQPAVEVAYDTILTEAALDHWIDKVKQAKLFALDTETTSLDSMRADLVGVSLSVAPHEAAYVPVMHDYMGAPAQLSRELVLEKIKPLLSDPQNTVVGQNLKYDIKVLKHYGVEIEATIVDTLLESYILNNVSTRHDMDSLAMNYLNHQTIKFTDVAGKGAKQLTFNQVELEKAAPYACEDADITLQLHHVLSAQIQKVPSMQAVLDEIEMPLMPILAGMEYTGVRVDADLLEAQSAELSVRADALKKQVFDIAGEEFNIDSPKQLQYILFEKLELPVLKKTPTGQASTAEGVLQELALDYPLPKLIIEYRSITKLKSTYTDKLPKQINPRTNRVHTHYHQTVTSTGRLSSTDPNLQNIPVRNEEGRRIRQAFVPADGYTMVSADYSQIELRIMAHLSQDPGLLKAFEEGLDVHQSTAAEVFNVELDAVTPELRRRAKAINFGLMYGMSAFGLAQQLGIDRKEAETHMHVYFEKYPKVKDYMHEARNIAAEQGYVETLFGRRVVIPEINSRHFQRRQAAERAAVNAPLQGTAADIIKKAMINVHQWICDEASDVRMLLQVHDELIFEVPTAQLDVVKPQIVRHMQDAVQLSVPLIVDVGVGQNWDEAH